MRSDGRTVLYRAFDADGRLLYVGITGDPLARWQQHNSQSPWWSEVVATSVEWFPTRIEAARAEARAVLRERPCYNRNLRNGRTKNRVFRMPDELWGAFADACDAEGITRTADLMAYMEKRVNRFTRDGGVIAPPKGNQAQHGGTSS